MCLIIFSWQPNSSSPLILAANRDEFHNRPSEDAHFWKDAPHIFAGRDLEKKGTWLGIARTEAAQAQSIQPQSIKPQAMIAEKTHSLRLSALTNFRSPDKTLYEHSRGEITTNFLNSSLSALDYVKQLAFDQFPGFNGLFFDGEALVYCHHEPNQDAEITQLEPGIYGLSNAKLDSPWPKVERSKQALVNLNEFSRHDALAKHLLLFLGDRRIARDEELPNTGVPLTLERMLSAAFIISPNYGTRTSTVVILEQKENRQSVYFKERQFAATGDMLREQTKHLY